MLPQQLVSGQVGTWLRQMMAYLEEQFRWSRRNESFYILASPIYTLLGTVPPGTLVGQQISQGLEDDFVITDMSALVLNEFSFNFMISGSQRWFFTNEVDSDAIFLGTVPYKFSRPILVKAGSGLTMNFTDQSGGHDYLVQVAFIGYRIKG
jgi:hypothetical protein